MTIQIEEGKYYRTELDEIVGPMQPSISVGTWRSGGDGQRVWDDNGLRHFRLDRYSGSDLVAEASAPTTDDHAVETVEGPQIAEPPEWAKRGDVKPTLSELAAGLGLRDPLAADPPDVKAQIADEAKRIVSGARRSAYGKPEQNFERIARLWQAHFENTGRPEAKVTANDISVFMVLMKIGRIAESPAHYDSWLDVVGYALTGAEVNGVTKPEKAA